ncbi:hypothetical protein G8T60_12745 [Clostridium botulinum C]|uniref:hypothetical protein n=1 Tax=Clostridium botulinum TaxID=1491 RepID=UPI001E443D76|nr:hypothetical protein [Clostridium botulinum]MCD3206757.1 hypothetical protein [Clostridium botulinum C]MCD3209658.1 hypothetical protein [Clostridium botulinum C]MCD3226557.1 hypothetical protein [Clostridium botulinum C]MCD3248991.1 hypothetical protein [Clostridium botulinum C]MCD3257575.1 hypothetical protein [Clostridium botulinum C]
MNVIININRFLNEKSYREKIDTTIYKLSFLLKEDRAYYTFRNDLAFEIITNLYNNHLEEIKQYRNKKVVLAHSPFKHKCIDLILK